MNELICGIKNKNNKEAYEYVKEIIAQSADCNKYLNNIPDFLALLDDGNSYVRTRAFCLISAQAKWADNGELENAFSKMKKLLNDEKPTVVRQCLAALHEVLYYRPEMKEPVKEALKDIDLSIYDCSLFLPWTYKCDCTYFVYGT